MKPIQRILACGTFLLAAALPGCGGGSFGTHSPVERTVSLLPASFEPGGTVRSVWFRRLDACTLELCVSGAAGLKAVYLEAGLPEGLELEEAAFTEALDPRRGTLSLALSPAPGRIVLGQVVARYQESPGLTGDAHIATLHLRRAGQARLASTPPRANAARTTLSLSLATGELSWLYYNPGDYDQNSEVNISDLTPMSAHFGEQSGGGPFGASTVQSVIDGDGNGEINISDITTIAANFGRICNGYKVYLSTELSDVPSANDQASTISALATATAKTGSPAQVRQGLAHTLASITPGAYYWVRPFEALSGTYAEGTPSTVVDVADLQENVPPVAALEVTETVGPPGLALFLDATGSTDSDGSVAKFRWDPEGDGSFFADANESAPQILVRYSLPGEYHPAVKVIDDLGAEDTATAETVTVSFGTPVFDVVDPSPGQVTTPAAIAMIEGSPAVSYFAGEDSTARYSRATTPGAGTWTAPRQLGAAIDTGTDLAVVGGNPTVVWKSGAGLIYRRAADGQGDAWLSPLNIALNPPGFDTGFLPDLETVDGRPAVLYGDNEFLFGGSIWYKLALDAEGLAWGSQVEVSIDGQRAGSAGLAIIDGKPSGLFINEFVEQDLVIAHGLDASGGSFGSPLVIDAAGKAAANRSSLQHLGGGLAVIYYESVSGSLLIAHATDLTGADWQAPEVICAAPGVGVQFTAARVNNLPVVAFPQSGGGLAYAIAKDPGGAAWNEPLTLVAGANQGRIPAVIEVDKRPVFVYLHGGDGSLMCLHYQ